MTSLQQCMANMYLLFHGEKWYKLSFYKKPFTTDVNLLDCQHFHMLANVRKSIEVKYLLQCRVPAKAVELHGAWFVSERQIR